MPNTALKGALLQIAQKNPPIAYTINQYDPPFRHMVNAFPPGSTGSKILHEAFWEKPEGIIVFGYGDDRSMKPITDILDQIPDLNYQPVKITDNRTLYLMSHWAARRYLPLPGQISYDKTRLYSLDMDLIAGLKAMSDPYPVNPRINSTGDTSLGK